MERRSAMLEAIASPTRQEILTTLDLGPATVADLARRLGRSRQALYHHLAILSTAGLVAVTGVRGEGRTAQRVFELVDRRARVQVARGSSDERATAGRGIAAMLRLTGREALEAVHVLDDSADRSLVAVREKAWLTPDELRRVNRLVQKLRDLLSGTDVPPQAATRVRRRLYSLTIVLTPARLARDGVGGRPGPGVDE